MAETLTLLVDKSNNRVVFAESDHKFVDILFSFLTLPIATIVRLLNASSSLGSFDRLYKSVQTLHPQFLQTDACKSMLLRPRSNSGARCEGLAINVDDSDHRVFYKCTKCNSCGVSWAPGVRCECGGSLEVPVMAAVKGEEGEGVFVKGEGRFMVSDDLKVRPVSMKEGLGFLSELGIKDGSVLEERAVELGKEEILKLLKRSLVSKMPLTDVFLQERDIIDVKDKSVMTDIVEARVKNKRTITNSKKINLKLYLSPESDKVVYAEGGEDLVDLVFSFLTFPLGSVVKLLDKHSSMFCIDNLYDSVELLSSDFLCIKSKDCKDMLLAPRLPPHFGSSHQLLSIEEALPEKIRTCACITCENPVYADRFLHYEVNPKRQNSNLGSGDGYARGMMKFMVTDELDVTPLSPIYGVHIIKKLMVPINSLEEAEVSVGEAEALNLLKACLSSNMVLSDAFSPYLLTLLEQNWCGQLPRKCDGFLD